MVVIFFLSLFFFVYLSICLLPFSVFLLQCASKNCLFSSLIFTFHLHLFVRLLLFSPWFCLSLFFLSRFLFLVICLQSFMTFIFSVFFTSTCIQSNTIFFCSFVPSSFFYSAFLPFFPVLHVMPSYLLVCYFSFPPHFIHS